MKITSFLIIAIAVTACNSKANKEAAIQQAKQQTIDSIKVVAEKQRIIDSMAVVADKHKEEERAQVRERSNASTISASEPTTVAKKKKGLNATATGALIGAGAGAITGAMVDGKKGEGAIVGGLIGAAAGAGTGAIIDGKKKKKTSN